jgi:hypothetical protein
MLYFSRLKRTAVTNANLAAIPSPFISMIGQIAIVRVIVQTDGTRFDADPTRLRRLALAALKPLARPTEAIVDAAQHAAAKTIRRWRPNHEGVGGRGVLPPNLSIHPAPIIQPLVRGSSGRTLRGCAA